MHITYTQNGKRRMHLLPTQDEYSEHLMEFREICARPGITMADMFLGTNGIPTHTFYQAESMIVKDINEGVFYD